MRLEILINNLPPQIWLSTIIKRLFKHIFNPVDTSAIRLIVIDVELTPYNNFSLGFEHLTQALRDHGIINILNDKRAAWTMAWYKPDRVRWIAHINKEQPIHEHEWVGVYTSKKL